LKAILSFPSIEAYSDSVQSVIQASCGIISGKTYYAKEIPAIARTKMNEFILNFTKQ